MRDLSKERGLGRPLSFCIGKQGEETMAVPGDKCDRCGFCGNELMDDLHVFCPISHKDPSDNNCWCICTECKVRFLNQIGPDLE